MARRRHPLATYKETWRKRLEARGAGSDEAGMSMAELGIVILLLSVLFAMTVPIMVMLFNTTTYVNATYDNEDQLIPVSTHIQSLVRGAVSPDPTPVSGVPVPAFGLYSTTSYAYTGTPTLTSSSILFFTNTGDPNGPSEVAATLSGPATDQVFVLTVAKANLNSCPGVSGGTVCTWGTPQPLLRVNNVVNQLNSSLPNFQPIFSYTLDGASLPVADSALATTFSTCNTTTCNADQIQNLGVDLKVNVSSNPNQSGQADDETVVYELSTTSQQYSATVG